MLAKEPLPPRDAEKLARQILKDGNFTFSRHAQDELAKDKLSMVDAVNIIRGGACQPPEFENREWRYRFETSKIAVVIAFRSETELRVITAWRKT